jgi:hypothetical protein
MGTEKQDFVETFMFNRLLSYLQNKTGDTTLYKKAIEQISLRVQQLKKLSNIMLSDRKLFGEVSDCKAGQPIPNELYEAAKGIIA